MVELKEITAYLDRLAPASLAEDYDNVGLLVGDKEAHIHRLLVSLDTDEHVCREAAERGAELIVSHHPLLFRPAKTIVKQDCIGKTIYSLITSGVSLYAMHTNFDSVSGGLGDYFLHLACGAEPFGCIEGEFPNGIGRIARLETETTFGEMLDRIKSNFGMKQIRYVGERDTKIRTVAACNGGGAELAYAAYAMGAEAYLSGDLKYHHARYAYENGLCLAEIPHYEAEISFCRLAAEMLQARFRNQCEILISEQNKNPWKIG